MRCWICDDRPVMANGLCQQCDADNQRHHDEHDRFDRNDGDDALWALDALDRVVGPDRLALGPTPGGEPEWDWLPRVSRRTLRRLRGARYMRRDGVQPDWLAQLIVPRVPGVETDGDAIDWYIKTCLVAIDEARLLAGRRRRFMAAMRAGHGTHYEHRTAQAKAMGYRSVWHMRKERGWTDHPT